MSTTKPEVVRPSDDYIGAYNLSFQIEPAKTALVVIDMQYATGSRKAGLGKRLTEEGKLDALARERFERIENVVVPNLQRMLAFCREKGLRVIYVTIGSEMDDYIDAPPHMVGLFKGTNNRKSGIDSLLRSMGIEYLLFAGVSTNMCVGTTARDAADRGYRCLLIEDCCGAAQNEYHRWETVNFQRLFGKVESSDNIMAEIMRNLKRETSQG
jgi:nicotinamidase-related amidase